MACGMARLGMKVGSHKSKLKQQSLADSQLLNDRTVLALEAPSRTVHATVPSISNSNPCPPVVFNSELFKPNHHVPSTSHGFLPQLHVDPSLSINHVFVEDYSDDDALDDDEVDYASSGEDYAGGSKFFTSSVFEAPSVPAASYIGAHSVPVASPACTLPDPVASPVRASSTPVAPAEVNVPLAATAHDSVAPVSNGRTSVFNCLGPQGDAVVVESPEANLPADCGPNPQPVEAELGSANGEAVSTSGAWEAVRNKKVKHKPPPSRPSSGSPSCLAPENPHFVHKERQPTPPLPVTNNTHASAPIVLAGHRIDKDKSMLSGASGHCPPRPTGLPTRKRAQQHMGGVPSKGEGLVHQFIFYASFVYELNTVTAQRSLWTDLRNCSPHFPWLVLGDFNSLLSQSDKYHGEPVSNYETADFRQCYSNLGLTDLNYSGCHFPWSNGRVWSNFDRALVNPFWSFDHSSVHVNFDNPGVFSNHSPATGPLRELNNLHYSHISERVARAEAALDARQTLFSNDRGNTQLHEADMHLCQNLLHLKAAE
ncbi:hypothetical protein Peur_004583 [Populus x canadensis]